MSQNQARQWVYDIGVHNGDDSAFYLAKGFCVLGVEANPALAAKARERFAPEIASGQYELVEAAVAPKPGHIEFFVNLEKDDWSSTDPSYGTRAGTRFEKISVPAVVMESLLERHPQVYSLKCDIEGGDIDVLKGMLRSSVRPKHVSFEAHDAVYLSYLAVLGYTRFKIVNQNLNWLVKLPNPPLEGLYVEHQFGPHCSGPFGEEAPGTWMGLEDTMEMFLALKKTSVRQPSISIAWYDFHATTG